MTSTLVAARPLSADFVSAASAPTFGVRNGHRFIEFPDSVDRDAYWSEVMPDHYSAAGLTVLVRWMATSAVAGDAFWGINFERHDVGGTDLDVDSFTTQQTIASTAQAAPGQISQAVIVFTDLQIDGLQAGESFRLRVRRVGTNIADTMSGGAQLIAVHIQQAGTGVGGGGGGFFTDGIGLNAALGKGTTLPLAGGENSFAQGDESEANAANCFALGFNVQVDEIASFAAGDNITMVDTTYNLGGMLAIGDTLTVSEYASAAIGLSNVVTGHQSFAHGQGHTLAGNRCAAFGYDNDSPYAPVENVFMAGQGNTVGPADGQNIFMQGEYNYIDGAYVDEVFVQGEDISLTAGGDKIFAQGDDISAIGGQYMMFQGDTIQSLSATDYGLFGQGTYLYFRGGCQQVMTQGRDHQIYGVTYSMLQGRNFNVGNVTYDGHSRVFAQGHTLNIGLTSIVTNVFAQGSNHQVNGDRTFAQGEGCVVDRDDQKTFSADRLTLGAAQWSSIIKHIETTNNTQTAIITLDLEVDKTYVFRAVVAARRTDANGDDASFVLAQGTGYRDVAGAAVLAGTPKALTKEIAAGAVNYLADIASSGNNILLRVTGDTLHTVEWIAVLEFAEVLG